MSTMHSRCSMLERSALLIVIVFIASTCSIWQENVRPKLYVELGKFLFISILHTVYKQSFRCIGPRLPRPNRIQKTYKNKDRKKKNVTKWNYMYWEIWISFDFIRVENNETSFRLRPSLFSLFIYFKLFFSSCERGRERKSDGNS